MSIPNRYDDPYWSDLATNTESKLDLPTGLLTSVILNGEKSNNDQSPKSTGAKTPFQITKKTRDLFLKNQGIDAFLSPENAAEVAGLVLKDGINFAKKHTTDESEIPRLAAGYYHAGGDVNQWGPKTKAYSDRVSQGLDTKQLDSLSNGFSDWLKNNPSIPTAQPAQNNTNQLPEPTDNLSKGFREWLKNPSDVGPNGETLLANTIPGQRALSPTQEPDSSIVNKAIGTGEAALSTATAATGGTVGQIGGTLGGLAASILDGSFGTPEAAKMVEEAATAGGQALTYAPRSPEGQKQTQIVGDVLNQIISALPLTNELSSLGRGVQSGSELAKQIIKPAVVDMVEGLRGGKPPIQAIDNAKTEQPISTSLMSGEQLNQTARTAANGGLGSTKATERLATQIAPDEKTIAAAQRLGIEDYLQPDHVTTNQAYRELAQAAKSIPGSEARASEIIGLEQIGKRADKLIDEIGGTGDLSSLDSSIKQRMQLTQSELDKKSKALYADVKAEIPAKTTVDAPNTLNFMSSHIDDLGGIDRLPPVEKKLYSALNGDDGPITYAYLDQQRKLIGNALRKSSGPFADSESGLLKKLYSSLSEDQQAIANNHNMGEIYNAAKETVQLRKGLEDDLKSLYGKNIDGSLVGNLSGAIKSVSNGDISKLSKLLQSTPENMRQEMMASGLNTAFGKATQNGTLNFNTYAKWYEGLLKNKKAYTLVMTNLPKSARKQLSDLYRVSKGVSQATRERITTGRINSVKDQLQSKDSSILSNLATGLAKGAAAEAVTSSVGLHGAGVVSGIVSSIVKGKPDTLKSVDSLISSSKFYKIAEKVKAKNAEKKAAEKSSKEKGK